MTNTTPSGSTPRTTTGRVERSPSSCSARRTSSPSRRSCRSRRSWSATVEAVAVAAAARRGVRRPRGRRRQPGAVLHRAPRAGHRGRWRRGTGPQVLLLGADNENASLAARVAARLGTGLSAHCVDLKLERGLLVQTVPGFGGQLMANIVCPARRPQMATVDGGRLPARSEDRRGRRGGRREALECRRDVPDGSREVDAAPASETATRRPWPQPDVVVAGGFGVGSKENWALVEDLARALHGAVGATRPPVDEGLGRRRADDRRERQVRRAEALRRRRHLRHDAPRRSASTARRRSSRSTATRRRRSSRWPTTASSATSGRSCPRCLAAPADGRGARPAHQAAGPHASRPRRSRRACARLKPNMYKHGRLIEDPVEDPGHAPDGRRPRADLRGGARPALPGAGDNDLAPDREADLALPVGHPLGRGHDRQQPDEAPDVPADRDAAPAAAAPAGPR